MRTGGGVCSSGGGYWQVDCRCRWCSGPTATPLALCVYRKVLSVLQAPSRRISAHGSWRSSFHQENYIYITTQSPNRLNNHEQRVPPMFGRVQVSGSGSSRVRRGINLEINQIWKKIPINLKCLFFVLYSSTWWCTSLTLLSLKQHLKQNSTYWTKTPSLGLLNILKRLWVFLWANNSFQTALFLSFFSLFKLIYQLIKCMFSVLGPITIFI